MARQANIAVLETYVFPPVPKNFNPIFLIGKNAIRATISLELNAVFASPSEIPQLKEMLKIALWHATINGPEKSNDHP